MTDYGANFYYEPVMSPPVSPMAFQQASPYPLQYQQQPQQQMPMMQQPQQQQPQQQQYYQPQQMQVPSPGYSQQELLDYLHSNSSTSSPSSLTGTTFSGFSSGFNSPSSAHNLSPVPYAAAANSPALQGAASLPAESPLRLTFNIKRKGKPLKNLYWTFRCSGQTRTPLSIEMTSSSCRFCLNCLNEIEDRPSTPHGPCRCGSTAVGTLSDIRFTPYLFNCVGGCYYGHLHNVIREKDEFIELPSEFPTDQHHSPAPVVNHGAPFDPSTAYTNGASYGAYPQQQQYQQQQQQMPIDYSLNGNASPYSGYSSPLSTSSSLPPTLGYVPPYGTTPPPSDMATSNGYYNHSGGTPSFSGSESPTSSGALSPPISLPTSVCHSYVLPQNVKIKPKKISDNNLHCHIGINVTIGNTTFSFGDQINQVGGAFDYYNTAGAPHRCADCCFLLDRKSGPDYFVNGSASICCEILAVTEFETEEQQPVINKYFGGLISPAFIATSRAIKAESITCFRVPPQVKSSYSQSAVVKPLMMTNCDGNLSRSIDGSSMTDGSSFFYDANNSITAVDFAIVQETLRTLLPNSYLDWSEILQRYLELSQINGGGDHNCHQQTGSLLTSLKSCPPPGAALSSSTYNQESLQRLLDRINKSKQFLEEQMESLKHSSELSPIRTNIFREGGLDRSLGLQPSLRQHAVEVLSAITSIVVESRAPNPNTSASSSTSRSITQDFSRSPFANLAATSAPPQPQFQQQQVGMKMAGLSAAPASYSISFPQTAPAPAPAPVAYAPAAYAAPAAYGPSGGAPPPSYGAPAPAPSAYSIASESLSSPYGAPGGAGPSAYSIASQSLSSPQPSGPSGYGQFPPGAYDQSPSQGFIKPETAAYPPSPVPAYNPSFIPNQTAALPSSYPVSGVASHCVGAVHPSHAHAHSHSLVHSRAYQNPNDLVQRMAETSLDPKAEKKLKKKMKKEQEHIIKHEKKEAKKAHKNSKGMPPTPTIISLASGGPVSVSSSAMSSASRNASPIHSSFLGSTRVVRAPPSQRAPPLPSQITQGLPSISLSFVRFSPETEARARKEFVPPSRWMLTFAKDDPIQYFVSNLSHEQWSMAFTIKLSKRFSSDSQTQQIEVPPFSVNNGFVLNISHYLFSVALLHTCFDIQADITFLFKSSSGRSACNQSQFFIDAHPPELEDY